MWFWLFLIFPVLAGAYCGIKQRSQWFLTSLLLFILLAFNFCISYEYFTEKPSEWSRTYFTGLCYSIPLWAVTHVVPSIFAYVFSRRAVRLDPHEENLNLQPLAVTAGGVQKTLQYDLNGNLRYGRKEGSNVEFRILLVLSYQMGNSGGVADVQTIGDPWANPQPVCQ